MTLEPPPLPEYAPLPPAPPAGRWQTMTGTVRRAWQVVLTYPSATILPMAAIQVPVALLTAISTVVLYLTAFEDEPVYSFGEAIDEGARGQLFAMIALMAVDVLFSLVARGATIVAVAGAIRGKAPTLTEALDPAFSRMGGLLLMAIVIGAGGSALVLSVIGLFLVPFLAIKLALSFEVFMLEGKGVLSSFGGSWRLTQGRMLSLLGVMLIAIAMVLIPFTVISLLGALVGGDHTVKVVLIAVTTMAQSVLIIPLLAFITAVTTVFYLDARKAADA